MSNNELKWFWASAMFVSIHDEVATERDLQERIVFLVRAKNDLEAKESAIEIARKKEHGYVSATESNVKWVFQSVVEVQELFDSEIVSGTEVFWEFIGAV